MGKERNYARGYKVLSIGLGVAGVIAALSWGAVKNPGVVVITIISFGVTVAVILVAVCTHRLAGWLGGPKDPRDERL